MLTFCDVFHISAAALSCSRTHALHRDGGFANLPRFKSGHLLRIRCDAKPRSCCHHCSGASDNLFVYAGLEKTSSYRIKNFYQQELTKYEELCPDGCPIWQARFYDFFLESEKKSLEKLGYMHENPVVAGLASTMLDWRWSSARFYELGEEVGVTITQSR